jgi:hypothetical protein
MFKDLLIRGYAAGLTYFIVFYMLGIYSTLGYIITTIIQVVFYLTFMRTLFNSFSPYDYSYKHFKLFSAINAGLTSLLLMFIHLILTIDKVKDHLFFNPDAPFPIVYGVLFGVITFYTSKLYYKLFVKKEDKESTIY